MLSEIAYGLLRKRLICTPKEVRALRTVLKQAGLPRMSKKTEKKLIRKLHKKHSNA